MALRVVGLMMMFIWASGHAAPPPSAQQQTLYLRRGGANSPFSSCLGTQVFIFGDRYLFDSKAGYAWSPHHYEEKGNTTFEFECMMIATYA